MTILERLSDDQKRNLATYSPEVYRMLAEEGVQVSEPPPSDLSRRHLSPAEKVKLIEEHTWDYYLSLPL